MIKTLLKFCFWTVLGTVAMGVVALKQSVIAYPTNQPTQIAQDTREPIGSIRPDQPIQIRVVSRTDVPLIATLVEPAVGDRPVAPQQSVTFGRLHTSYLSLPIEMTVYVEEQGIDVFFEVSTSGNEIIVDVTTVVETEDEQPGNSTQSIQVDKQGLIYLY